MGLLMPETNPRPISTQCLQSISYLLPSITQLHMRMSLKPGLPLEGAGSVRIFCSLVCDKGVKRHRTQLCHNAEAGLGRLASR